MKNHVREKSTMEDRLAMMVDYGRKIYNRSTWGAMWAGLVNGRTLLCLAACFLIVPLLAQTGMAAEKLGFSKSQGGSSGSKFAKKECLDCHKKFADKYLGMKNVHAVVKEKNCEACHLRHGIVPKLLLKKNGNELCLGCHTKKKIGLNKSNVHTVLKRGNCTICHDPHASQGSHLLKKEGGEVCYECHKKEEYEKKVVP